MMPDVSIQEALDVKASLEAVDDVEDLKIPLKVQDQDMVDDYYADGNAL